MAYGAGLESQLGAIPQGFKSLILRRINSSKLAKVNFFQKGKSDKSIETMYEIYDQYGNIVKKGFGSKLDVSNLPKGGYFLNYDNKMGEFVKK